jgi:NTE family protein
MSSSIKLKDILKKEPLPVALSAGFFGFFSHLGFMEALKQEGIEISMISGSSAGALVGAIIGSNISTQDALKLLTEIPVKDVWDPGIGLGYLKWRKVESILETHLTTRLEDLNLKVAVSVFELRTFKTKVFTSGPTAQIIRATCTPPFLVHPAKIGGRRYLDGGIFDKFGILGMPKEQRFLSHFLMSHLPDRKWDLAHNLKKKRANQLVMSFSDLIEVKPSNLNLGYKAFDRSFENTIKILNTNLDDLKNHQSFYGNLDLYNLVSSV